MNASHLIENIMEKICDGRNILPENHFLLYSGKKLEGGRTLADYGIFSKSDEYTLHLCRRGMS
jgi:hypothetical protein